MRQETSERAETSAIDKQRATYFDTRERAFLLATRLTYQKWLAQNYNPPISEAFWQEVRTLSALIARAKQAAFANALSVDPGTEASKASFADPGEVTWK